MTSETNGPSSSFGASDEMSKRTSKYKWRPSWNDVLVLSIDHIGLAVGLCLILTASAKWQTIAFAFFLDVFSGIGVTAGAHRLWAHRSYKAKLPLRILLAFSFTMTGQYSIIEWVRIHRTHHKYADTDGDPHNSKRGFFYSHIGWLIIQWHPEASKKSKSIDMRDLYADPVARIQNKYYLLLVAVCHVFIPSVVPMMLWEENLLSSFFIACAMRRAVVLHQTCCVNSVAHMWGYKPYNRHICPVESNWVALISAGEGFHNYHHTFPWDYSASELGFPYNLTTGFIDLMAWAGQAYDLKRASPGAILQRKKKTSGKLNSYEELQS